MFIGRRDRISGLHYIWGLHVSVVTRVRPSLVLGTIFCLLLAVLYAGANTNFLRNPRNFSSNVFIIFVDVYW